MDPGKFLLARLPPSQWVVGAMVLWGLMREGNLRRKTNSPGLGGLSRALHSWISALKPRVKVSTSGFLTK